MYSTGAENVVQFVSKEIECLKGEMVPKRLFKNCTKISWKKTKICGDYKRLTKPSVNKRLFENNRNSVINLHIS